MPIVADAAAAVRADLRPFEQDLKSSKATKPVEKFGTSISNTLKGALSPAALIGGFAGGFAAFKAADFLGESIGAAAEFQDTVSATGVIFDEEFTPALERWAETAHASFGASKQDALAAANQFAVFGKSAGLAGQELVDFSTEMVQLGGDLASFFGGTTQDAITAVGAALRGESEPIRRYGVLLDDATLRQRAFEMGLISTTKNALTPQQRVLAAHAEILAQTTDAQGDFVRTSDGVANQMRETQARIENLQIEIGEALLPVMADLLGLVNDLIDGLDELGGVVDALNAPFAAVEEAIGTTHDAFLDFGIELDPGEWAVGIHNFVDDAARDLLGLQPAIRDTGAEATTMSQEWAEAWKRSTEATQTEGGAIVDATEDTMTDAAGEVEEGSEVIVGKFGEIPGEGADAMLDQQWRLKDATSQLIDFMDQAMTRGEEIAQLRGFLTSKALAHGLASNNPLVRQKAKEMADAAVARLNELGAKGYKGGANLSKGVAEGIDDFSYLALQASARLAAGVAGFLPVNSPPENPDSALANIYQAGDNIVDAVTSGILRQMHLAEDAAASLSRALVPNALTGPANVGFSRTFRPAAAISGGGGNTFNVTTASRPKEKSTLEIAHELRRAEYLGVLPGVKRDD